MARLVAFLLFLLLPMAASAQDEVTFDEMRDAAQGAFSSLTSFVTLDDSVSAACDMARKGQTYGVLFGADSFGPGSSVKLAGTGNSVALLAETLAARGVQPGNLISLTGSAATRQGLATALDALSSRLNCTDHVVFFLTAVSADTKSIAGWMSRGFSQDDWIAASADSDPVMRAIVEAGPFLLGNPSEGAVEEILSAAAVSEVITWLRNRAAHVTMILDTTYAAGFELSARQMAVDGKLLWREFLSEDSPAPTGPPATPLSARAGGLSVLYSADRTSMSAEMQMPPDSPDAAVYGLFVFKLAAAMNADAPLTMPALARQIAALELAPEYRNYQNHVLETTDPSLPLLAEDVGPTVQTPPEAPASGGPEVIRISAPDQSRAAAALEEPMLTIKGQVEWPEETLIVLVGQEQALSRADGAFQHEIALKEGLNRIEIVALTRDNRQHSRVLEVSYSGDPGSLGGRGQRYALMIANQTYGGSTGMPALQTPFADIDALSEVLVRRYGFVTEVTLPDGTVLPLVLKDATRAQIETTLFQLSRAVGEADQLLIYYGGHGVFEQVTGTAFWVPADAISGVPPSYLSASGISEALLRLQAGSVIVISDSCYSGALLREAAGVSWPDEADRARALARLSEKRARVLISSGANEPVADGGGEGHSIFARALLVGLTQAQEPLAAHELFDDFVFPIVIGRAEQEPQYRPIAKSGHEGGDFVFFPQSP